MTTGGLAGALTAVVGVAGVLDVGAADAGVVAVDVGGALRAALA